MGWILSEGVIWSDFRFTLVSSLKIDCGKQRQKQHFGSCSNPKRNDTGITRIEKCETCSDSRYILKVELTRFVHQSVVAREKDKEN